MASSLKSYVALKAQLKRGKGNLHRALGIPQSQKIPAARLTEALHSKNSHVRAMANEARNMKHWNH